MLGSVYIPLPQVLKALAGLETSDNTWASIIWKIRLPRCLAALLAGSALSVSGLLMQTLFRNPIAGPFVLGISSGASLGVALFILLLAGTSFPFVNLGLLFFAAAGAFLVLLLVLAASWKIQDMATLLIIGLMVGSATGAFVSILQYFSGEAALKRFVVWSFGNLSGILWNDLYLLVPLIIVGLIAAFLLSKNLNLLLLGSDYAKSMGLNIKQNRMLIILLTALLAGSITAFCGPIAFVGIAVPHLARMLFKTQQHRILIPATILIGGALLIACDLIAQVPFSDLNLPLNAITALFGAPLVIWVILKRRIS